MQSGRVMVRHADGETEAQAGDAFVFKPDEPHQLINRSEEDCLILVIADKPIGESCHYPDSGKWLVRSPERRILRSKDLDYYDGEERRFPGDTGIRMLTVDHDPVSVKA